MFHNLSCLPILGEQLSLQIETSPPSLIFAVDGIKQTPPAQTIVGLALVGKDIVFRFMIECSSLILKMSKEIQSHLD
jgi:hypothetical protein